MLLVGCNRRRLYKDNVGISVRTREDLDVNCFDLSQYRHSVIGWRRNFFLHWKSIRKDGKRTKIKLQSENRSSEAYAREEREHKRGFHAIINYKIIDHRRTSKRLKADATTIDGSMDPANSLLLFNLIMPLLTIYKNLVEHI